MSSEPSLCKQKEQSHNKGNVQSDIPFNGMRKEHFSTPTPIFSLSFLPEFCFYLGIKWPFSPRRSEPLLSPRASWITVVDLDLVSYSALGILIAIWFWPMRYKEKHSVNVFSKRHIFSSSFDLNVVVIAILQPRGTSLRARTDILKMEEAICILHD